MTRLGVTIGLDDAGAAQWASAAAVISRALRVFGEVDVTPANAELPAALRTLRPDIVFNAARDVAGRAATALTLEQVGIPFTGSSSSALTLTASRDRMKEALGTRLIPTAVFTVVHGPEDLVPLTRRSFPLVVFRTSNVFDARDCVVVEDAAELEREAQRLWASAPHPVLVERYLPGSAFACLVLGNGADRVVLPPVSLVSGSNPADSPSIDHVPEGLREGVERVVLETCRALDLRDLARVDIALSERGVPHVLSADPLPDLTGDMSNPVLLAADSTGLDQVELIQRTLHVAAARTGLPLPQSPMFDDLRYRTPPRGLRLRTRHA
jgi:D-alanine-D-alanine ligase